MITHGKKTKALELQPGWTYNERFDKTISGAAIYHCDKDKFFANKPKIGASFEKYEKLKIIDVQATFEDSIAVVNVSLFGLLSNPTKPVYSYLTSFAEEDIQTHPDFVSKIAGTKDDPINGALFDSSTGEFLGFPASAGYNLAGVRGYLTGTPVIRRTWFTSKVFEGIEDIGQVYKIQSGKIPGVPAGTNGLKITWSSHEIGANYYQINEDFQLSGSGGWNELIYKFSGKA